MKVNDLKSGDLIKYFGKTCMFLSVKRLDIYSSEVYLLSNKKMVKNILNIHYDYLFLTKL